MRLTRRTKSRAKKEGLRRGPLVRLRRGALRLSSSRLLPAEARRDTSDARRQDRRRRVEGRDDGARLADRDRTGGSADVQLGVRVQSVEDVEENAEVQALVEFETLEKDFVMVMNSLLLVVVRRFGFYLYNL